MAVRFSNFPPCVQQLSRTVLPVLISMALGATLYGQDSVPITVPVLSAPGWRADGVAVVDGPGGLSRLESAIEPMLKAYGLERRISQKWMGPQGSVRSAVYQMVDSAGAYGYYSSWRASQIEGAGYAEFPFGAEGFRVGDRRTMFWVGPYVVELNGDMVAVRAWAELATSGISGSAGRPPVIQQLPTEHRVPGSEEYLANRPDAEWGVDPSRLGLDRHAEGARALYRIKGKTVRLLFLIYPTQQLAMQYEGAFDGPGLEKRWKRRVGPIIAVASGDAQATAAILDSVRHDYEVTWNEAPPDVLSLVNPGVFMGSLFQLIGLVAVLAVGTGVIMGGLRIYFKWRYPNQVFDRASEFEMIQLKLNRAFTIPTEKPSGKD